MTRAFRIKEQGRDEDLAVIRKSIPLSDGQSITTPTRSIKSNLQKDDVRSTSTVNEVVRKFDEASIIPLEEEEGATARVKREVRSQFLDQKLNLVIFDLTFDKIPERNLVRTLANQLYAASGDTITLPTVKSSLFREIPAGRKTPKFSERLFEKYQGMMNDIITEISAVGNNKAFIGTVPLVPVKYARLLIDLYTKNGITAFAIDANFSDVISNEADLRGILSEISQKVPLDKSFIYACNLGYPKFDGVAPRADDFLSLFAYIDVMGSTFKTRGFSKPIPRPRKKQFSRDEYSYNIIEAQNPTAEQLRFLNPRAQLKEAHKVRDMLGEASLKKYIQEKPSIDPLTLKRLEAIAKGIR